LEAKASLSSQVRVVDEQADVGRDALDEADLLASELATRLPPHEEETTHAEPARQGGRHEQRARVHALGDAGIDAWIVLHVAGPARTTITPHVLQLRHPVEDEGALEESLEPILGYVPARRGHQDRLVGGRRVDPYHVGTEGEPHLAGDPPQ